MPSTRVPGAPRHLLAGALAFAAALALVPLAAVPVAADRSVTVTVRDPSMTFYGRGWGHGVGMSQYGARGRALDGQTTGGILAHYYQGTTLGPIDPATTMRVLVLADFRASSSAPLLLHGRGGAWTIDGLTGSFPADAALTLVPTAAGSTTWRLGVRSSAGASLRTATVGGAVVIRPASSASRLQVDSRPSDFDTYRGLLKVHLSTTANVVNHVGLDAYLRGVVPAEMPASWPAAAVRAQAIAARSYAASHRRSSSVTFDVYDDTRSQVYRGVEGEAAATNTAIDATAGVVLRSGSAIANALFHSTGGGATENNENVFVSATGAIVAGPVTYLRGSPDRRADGSSYDAAAPFATWQTRTYRMSELSAIFGADARTAVGSLRRFDLSARGVSGRLIRVTLIGSTTSKTVSGDVFRSVFNSHRASADPMLRSTLFDTAPIP
jgi:stage II sporulation protein D